MCIICKKESEQLLCDKCATTTNVTKICRLLLSQIQEADKSAGNLTELRKKAALILELTECYPGISAEYYRVKALLWLKRVPEAAKLVIKYASAKKGEYKTLLLLSEVSAMCMQNGDYDWVITISDIRIADYRDISGFHSKAEALLKLWQPDKAIVVLEEAYDILQRDKSKDESHSKKVLATKKKLTDYKSKRLRGYHYFPDSINARNKLYNMISAHCPVAELPLLACDDSLADDSFVAFDLEFTHHKGRDKIIEISAVKVKNGKMVACFSQLVNPKAKVNDRICELTGITNDMLSDKPKIESVFPGFVSFVEGLPLLAHDVTTDICLLVQMAERLGYQLHSDKTIDTLLLAKKYYPNLTHYGLEFIADELYISQDKAHRALCDAITAAKLYLHIKNSFQK